MNMRSMSSRILIVFILALALLVAMSGCQPTETPLATTEEVEEPTEEVMELEDELNVLTWGYYIDFALEPFEEKYGVKVNYQAAYSYYENAGEESA